MAGHVPRRLLSAFVLLLAFTLGTTGAEAQRRRGRRVERVERSTAKRAGRKARKAARARIRRRVGSRNHNLNRRIHEGAEAGKRVLRGYEAARGFRNYFKVDLVERKGQKPFARLNAKKVKAEIERNGSEVTLDQVKKAWADFQRGEKYLTEHNLDYRPPYQSLRIGTLGADRRHVTRLSLADPGPEHRMITALEPEILKNGVIVHNEFINRENDSVQPYRAPNPLETKLVTYSVAAEAPVSVYLGLPNFPESLRELVNDPRKGKELRNDPERMREALRTPATEVVDVAKSRFNDGAAELKVRLSPEQMKYASTMVQFMVKVNRRMGKHSRDPEQVLSAQFNLNEPIIDDLGGGKPKLISNPRSLADLSIRIMGEAKRISEEQGVPNAWQKWAPDGAFPKPGTRVSFIELLGGLKPGKDKNGKPRTYTKAQEKKALVEGTKRLVDIVNNAHELGLETYISAGMDQTHMEWATYAGVDGVGIGTALHERTTEAGKSIMGRLSPDKVKEALSIRDAAEKSTLGKGATELYRLAFAKSRGRLKGKSNARYKALLDAMKNLDEGRVAKILKDK